MLNQTMAFEVEFLESDASAINTIHSNHLERLNQLCHLKLFQATTIFIQKIGIRIYTSCLVPSSLTLRTLLSSSLVVLQNQHCSSLGVDFRQSS